MPRHPSELEMHDCFGIRSIHGSVMDLWQFRRGEGRVSVAARGWMVTDNVHRDMVRDLVLAGCGVARLLDWHQRQGHEMATGALVPALTEWTIDEVPPVNLMYPASVRRIPRVRPFINFVTQLFGEIDRPRAVRTPGSSVPRWTRLKRSRASANAER